MNRILLLFTLISSMALGQKADHFNLELRAALETTAPEEEMNLFIRGDLSEITNYVRSHNGIVKGIIDPIASVRMPASAVRGLRHAEFVDFIEFSLSKPRLLSDVMLVNNNVHPIHAGVEPLPQAYLGEDVIVGIIDSNLEFDHPDFQHEDGTTRVLALWDHNQEEEDLARVPEPYGYGQEYTSEDIDLGITNHDPSTWGGHGSTVAGVACGNGNATGTFLGVAPEADIIVVASNFSLMNWKASIADAVDFIFQKAEEMGKPAVINASLGDYYGSHDGLDAAALFIDDLLEEQSGRVMVSAAGNSNAFDPYHLSYEVPETDTAFTWFSYNTNSAIGEPAVFFELWADSSEFFNTQFAIGADLTDPNYEFRGYSNWRNAEVNLDSAIVDTIFMNDEILGIVETWCGKRGDQYQVQVAVTDAFSDQYKWRFATTGGGKFDVWSYGPFGTSVIESEGLPDAGEFIEMTKYRYPDLLKTIVDSWACSDKVLTVANYVNRNEYTNVNGELVTLPDFEPLNISVNSSSGPTRDERQKPDISATGDIILSAGSLEILENLIADQSGGPDRVAEGGWHYRNGGTSMAAPAVAGVAALYLERDPEATYAEIKMAIEENALADEYTGVLPNYRWGYGKLNGFATLTEPFGVTSASHVKASESLKIYPNPTKGQLFIETKRPDLIGLSLFDLSGRQVHQIGINPGLNPNLSVDLSHLSSGVYVVRASFNEGMQEQYKIIFDN